MALGSRWRPGMRRLLQADRPAETRSQAALEAEVEKNYRWNFAVNSMDVMWFWIGTSFISSTTIVPLFISKLSPNPFYIALAAIIAQGAWYFPQLLTANPIERLARMKPVVVNLGFFSERLPLWLMALAPPAALISPMLALFIFLFGYAWHGLGAGAVAPAWQELIGRCFPRQRRGRFLGTAMFLGAIGGSIGALISIRLLGAYAFPKNFTIIFLLAAVAITVSWAFLALVREPVQPSTLPRQSNRQYFAGLPAILERDSRFRRYISARLLLVFGAMGSSFVTVAAIQRWQIPDSQAGVYTVELLLGQVLGNLLFGFMSDRYGHRLILRLGALAALLAYVLAWRAPSPIFYDITFFLLGIQLASTIVSGILIVLEFAPAERTPTYVGLANTAVGLATLAGPLLAAGLAGIDYSLLFAVSAVFNLAAWAAFRWWVPDPRSPH